MTPFATVFRAVLWLVLVAGTALSVFWLVTGLPRLGPWARIPVVVVTGAAAVGLAALPDGHVRRKRRL